MRGTVAITIVAFLAAGCTQGDRRQSEEDYYQSAAQSAAAGHRMEAVQILEDAIRVYPESSRLHFFAGYLLERESLDAQGNRVSKERLQKAMDYVASAVQLNPTDHGYKLVLGIYQTDLGEAEAAVHTFESVFAVITPGELQEALLLREALRWYGFALKDSGRQPFNRDRVVALAESVKDVHLASPGTWGSVRP